MNLVPRIISYSDMPACIDTRCVSIWQDYVMETTIYERVYIPLKGLFPLTPKHFFKAEQVHKLVPFCYF